MMAMERHSRWMGVTIDTIHATGGAAVNRDILQVMADVFDADVHQFAVANSASLGAALRAYHADRLSAGRLIGWDEVIAGFAEPGIGSRVRPVVENLRVYAALKERYAAVEAAAIRG